MDAGERRAEELAGATARAAEPRELLIVGIGASAGGLEALERLFKRLPDRSGMAFVVIQHLSPDFKSLMDELLARHTRMAIHRASSGMRVEADSVYLLPPRKEMTIAGGHLVLTDKGPQRNPSMPIDRFFRSLAQDAGRRAVAIVLSGTGSDGSRGVRDVHEAGGLVLVQSLESAQFDGMPRSARDSGVADRVLTPEEMSRVLLEHARTAPGAQLCDGGASGGVDAIFELLRDEHGIDFSHYKPNTVGRRIERRLALSLASDLDGYVERLRTDRAELNALYRDLLIGVTRFFRDGEAFTRLEHGVLPELLTRRGAADDLRLWIAGCATGEEAYSLAILLDERCRLLGRRPNVKIFASDVHRASLEVAGAGVYCEDALSELSQARLERYFVKRPDGYHVTSQLRQMIVFALHNVIRDAPFTRLDLVTCRNLLIYFQHPVQRKVLSLFHFGLKTGGVLFLGPSESPGDLGGEFEEIDARWKIYRKRRDVRLPPDLRLPLAMPSQLRTLPAPAAPAGALAGVPSNVYERLLERWVPDGVLLSERRLLRHSFGDAARFLAIRPGRTSNDVLDLVHPDLRLPLAGALQRAVKDHATISRTVARLRLGDENERVTLSVERILDRHGQPDGFFVSFASDSDGAAPAPDATAATAAPARETELVESLEEELRHVREDLQATVEELETSNEEMQAANEELVAGNEELQSTNEELHSVNQELHTVNTEYQKKIQELTELTDDMDNLLRSTDVGTIFLDRDLCIRKFTPQIARAFDLLPHDVGRRIDTFAHNIRYAGLNASLERVLETGEKLETDVQDKHGGWFFLRVLPYHSRSAPAGVVLTLIDISPLRRAETRLAQMSAIVESSDDAIIGLDLDGRIVTWNDGAERLYGYRADEVRGEPATLLYIDSADERHAPDWTPEVLERMRCGRPAGYQLETVRLRKDGTRVDVLLSCSSIRDANGTLCGMSIIARDIGGRRAAERSLAERARLSSLRAELALALARSESLAASLQRCTEILVEHVGAGAARIWLLDDATQVLEPSAGAGLDRDLEAMGGRIGSGEHGIGRVAAERRPLFAGDDDRAGHELSSRDGGAGSNGHEAPVSFAGYPLVIADRLVGVVGIRARHGLPALLREDFPSITYEIAQCVERKRAEEASRRYAEELERANEELRESVARRRVAEAEANDAVDRRDRFLAILSHELRNPLAAVLNAACLLERGGSNDGIREQAHRAIGRQTRIMARLLDDLLDVSRITRNKIQIKNEVIDIAAAAREACELVRSTVAAHDHRLAVDLPDDAVHVDGDPARFQQIVVNLLTNAVKYTPRGGRIALSIERADGMAVLRVRDTGPGIPETMREKVFDLFVQLESAVGKSDGGMGVGLTLVRALVGLHGGTIAIGDAPGGGSEFTVRLPLTAARPADGPPAAASSVFAGLRVLVIEDNPDIRITTAGLLRDFGCRVTSAEDGARGVAALEHDAPEVALIDIGMPGLSGYEVAERIRQRADGRAVLLIALTGFGQEEDRARARAAGFDAHLVKPIDFDQLGRTIERLRG